MGARRQDAVSVVDREAEFGVEELFFSTTDTRGFLTAGNDVFVRISGYPREELIGRPHNVVRHPDMPRVVFRILWDHLKADRPVAAYVKNRCSDGRYYWVMAAARPAGDGYLSIRLKPTSGLLPTVRDVYAELNELERGIERAGGSRSEAMEASSARLDELLQGLGHRDYGEFMESALAAEITSRGLGSLAAGTLLPPVGGATGDGSAGEDGWEVLARDCAAVGRYLDRVFVQVESFIELDRRLAAKTDGLLVLADNVALVALNAVLASGRLGTTSGTLEVVAGAMRENCSELETVVRALVAEIHATMSLLGDLGFTVALGDLQTEMARFFVDELRAAADEGVEPSGGADAASRNVALLVDLLVSDARGVLDAIEALREHFLTIDTQVAQLGRGLEALRVLEMNGRVEAAREGATGTFGTLFDQVRSQVAEATDDAAEIAALVSDQHLDVDDGERAAVESALLRLGAEPAQV